jgi:hypothetical protein
MFKYFIASLLFIFTMYACSMGSPYNKHAKRDPLKGFWVRCADSVELWKQSGNTAENWQDYACYRRCSKRNKLKKCKEYEVLTKEMNSPDFKGFVLVPEYLLFGR